MFKNKMFALLFMVLVNALLVSAAVAQTGGLVTIQSKSSFDKTIDQLKELVAKNGMMVLSELNQGKVMETAGLKLNAVSLFVGNPTVGKKLFAANHGVGANPAGRSRRKPASSRIIGKKVPEVNWLCQ